MPAWINKASICILAWCIYDFQGLLLPKGTLFSQLLLIVLILVSLYYMFVANTRYKLPKYFWGLNVLIFMFTIYGVYLMIGYNPYDYSKQVESSSYLKGIYISLLPIYTFFVFFKEKLISLRMIYFWVVVFFALATGEYYDNQKQMLVAAMLSGSKIEEFTNNAGYVFLALMPACTFFYKKSIIQYIGLAYCMIFLFMGMKRGALLIGIICLLWILWNNLKVSNMKKKIAIMFFSLVLCIMGNQFVEKKMENSVYFQKRVEDTMEGNTSRRDDLYMTFANYYLKDASPMQFLFGSGANATLKVSYNYAHNDWLEIAVNQGLLGLMVYLFYWFLFLRECFSKFYTRHAKLALQLVFIIYFMQTIFSMSYGAMVLFASLVLGYSLSQEVENEQIVYSN